MSNKKALNFERKTNRKKTIFNRKNKMLSNSFFKKKFFFFKNKTKKNGKKNSWIVSLVEFCCEVCDFVWLNIYFFHFI